jgi:hypothetical protein
MLVPLTLSAFTHLFNPIGFPCVHPDEGVYIRRTMHVLVGLGPQDPASRFDHGQDSTSSYDHPYFGQIFLAGVLGIIGYPDSLNPSLGNVHSIEMLYIIPRLLMGILAVVDTFLLYKIAERRYNRTVALVASVLFAVMPITWLLRRIFLDSIVLPFLLSSILFAVYYTKKDSSKNKNNSNNKNLIPILLSGIFLGLAIFTKIPAFTMIPVVGFLIYQNSNRNLKMLGIWFIPVILIPLIWPAYSIWVGHFDEWLNGVLWQGTGRQGKGILSINSIFRMDPVLVVLALTGIIFAAIKKDFFLLVWVISFLIYTFVIGWVMYFHWILVLPAFCIAAAKIVVEVSTRILEKRKIEKILTFIVISGIGIFGFTSTAMLITTNVNFSYFKIYAFIVQYLMDLKNVDNKNDKITVIGSHWWIWNSLWIPKFVFDKEDNFISAPDRISHHFLKDPLKTEKVLFLVDEYFTNAIISRNPFIIIISPNNTAKVEPIKVLYNHSKRIATFMDNVIPSAHEKYPYTSMPTMIINEKRPLGRIDIRVHY